MNWDKEELYDKEIGGLVTELYEKCWKLGFPLLCVVQYREVDHETSWARSCVLADIDVVPSPDLLAAALVTEECDPRVFKEDVVDSIMTVRTALEKELEQKAG